MKQKHYWTKLVRLLKAHPNKTQSIIISKDICNLQESIQITSQIKKYDLDEYNVITVA